MADQHAGVVPSEVISAKTIAGNPNQMLSIRNPGIEQQIDGDDERCELHEVSLTDQPH